MNLKKCGFTLAEILITLSIIGIVAAITIPSLMANVQEKAWESQRKALAARMSQTFPQLSKLNGYGIGTDGKIDTANAAQIFITEGLSKVYKIASVCSKDNISSCGISSQIATMGGTSTIAFPLQLSELNSMMTESFTDDAQGRDRNTEENGGIVSNVDAAAFETMNGESIALFYNPKCRDNSPSGGSGYYGQGDMCVNMIYDLNGLKAPNQVGKDIGFISVLYSNDPVVVAPVPQESNAGSLPMYAESGKDALSACKTQDTDSRIPDRYEAYSMFINMKLFNGNVANLGDFWTSTIKNGAGKTGNAWYVCSHAGEYSINQLSTSHIVWCIKK